MAVCEILCVGTELLLGDILNTNEQFLSKELAAMGISVMHRSSVGDNPERLAQELKTALGRSDIVITSGGLGPTDDDLTKEVCCEVMGFELREDEDTAERIRSYFKSKGGNMPENNLKQAMLPVGGTVFENNHGTAPGAALEKNGKCVIILPGPPGELAPMFNESVRGFLKKYSDGAIVSHTVNIIGMGESFADRAEMAFELRALGVKSMPLNVLNPIPGTPYEKLPRLAYDEIRRTAALFRFILPDAAIRMAGGRGMLADKGRAVFRSGANAAISGDMLTTAGISVEEDMRMIKELGYEVKRP